MLHTGFPGAGCSNITFKSTPALDFADIYMNINRLRIEIQLLRFIASQNSILSRVKTMLISLSVCEKKQRLEVARGFTVFTSQFYLLHTIPTQPGGCVLLRSLMAGVAVGINGMPQPTPWRWHPEPCSGTWGCAAGASPGARSEDRSARVSFGAGITTAEDVGPTGIRGRRVLLPVHSAIILRL